MDEAAACAAVGALKLRSNQAATAGWNRDKGFIGPVEMWRSVTACAEVVNKGPMRRGINARGAGMTKRNLASEPCGKLERSLVRPEADVL
jgi:hypothetical protein